MSIGTILGIDPGLPQTGYAVCQEGVVIPQLCGIWRHGTEEGSEEDRQGAYGFDLLVLWEKMVDVAGTTPHLLATEAQFQRRNNPEANARSLIIVAAMRGFFVGYCRAVGVKAVKVPANVAFRALTGNSKADEDQRRAAAGRLLGRDLLKGEIHLADALGFGLAVEAREEHEQRVRWAQEGGSWDQALDALRDAHRKTAGAIHDEKHEGRRPGVARRVTG